MAVDVATKPTLASYNIRPDAFDPKRPGPPNKLQTAVDRDEATLGRATGGTPGSWGGIHPGDAKMMLAVVDRHSEVADGSLALEGRVAVSAE
eukprot:Skav236806  [mRNA]  locus=scaffold3611:76162:76993:- [translate_table: standard]